MISRVIPELIELAGTSVMSSKHAAAIVSGKRALAMAVNYPLPAGNIVDFAINSRYFESPPHHQRPEFGFLNLQCEKG